MRNKYEVPNQEPFNGRVRIYDNNEKHYVYSFMLRGDAKELADKLNRLAALEAVCREIVKNAPTSEDEFEGDDIPIWESIPMSTKYLIAQKLKAVLEEA